MASYGAKRHAEMLETESGRIAFALNFLDNYHYVSRDWYEDLMLGNGVEIYDGIYVYHDGKHGFYYTIIKPSDMKPNRYWYKVVHMYDSFDNMVEMLDAQVWAYT